MDSWPRSREVEKAKPFAERASAAIWQLEELQGALGVMGIKQPCLDRAMAVLKEAITRGVKGKEPV
jgi:hypothetical protein